jgi:hypothetical protein
MRAEGLGRFDGEAGGTARELVEISCWVDEGLADGDPTAVLWERVAKVAEEAGEVIGALIGMTGGNRRKGCTHTGQDVVEELLDVAVAALAAVEHMDGHEGQALALLADKVSRVHQRAGIPERNRRALEGDARPQSPTDAGAALITAAETAPAPAGHGIAGPDAQPQVSPSRPTSGEDGGPGASDAVAAPPVTAPGSDEQLGRKCPKCDGCGRIGTDDDGTPWAFWENLPVKSAAAVVLGLVRPVTCPTCGGTGSVPR